MTTARPPMVTAREAPSRPKVVYIMGAGRSGSTILGVSLGNCADLVYAGELDKWPARSGRPAAPGAEQERFWGAVRSRLSFAFAIFAGDGVCVPATGEMPPRSTARLR